MIEKLQDKEKKSHITTQNEQKTDKQAQDVQKNCLSLTEQWKNGGLKKDKKYYTKDKLGRTYIKTYNKKGFKGLVEEVLCEVPSYEKWKIASEQLNKNGVWYTERSYKELLKEKRLLEVSVNNRDNNIQELQEENEKLRKWCEEFNALDVAKENAKLKELLKECYPYIKLYTENKKHFGFTPDSSLLLTKIDEVLK